MGSFLALARILLLSLLVSTAVADDKGNGNGNGNGGKCKKPSVRREWRSLSDKEQGDWVKAMNCLTTIPHDDRLTPIVPANESLIPPINKNTSLYDDFVYMHMDLNVKIHFTGMFLPWHRYYVHFLEKTMKEKCGYKGASPYWDWTLDAEDIYNSDIFDDSDHGVGGWGDPENDSQITTGGFKDIIRPYPSPHHIRRNFTQFPFDNPTLEAPFAHDPAAPPPPEHFAINATMTKTNVDFLTNGFEGNFFGFHGYMESLPGVHAGAHLILAGDMTGLCPNGAVAPECVVGPKWTPNDPLFFLHHSMIDKIWYDWQEKGPKNKYSFGGGSVTTFGPNYTLFATFPTGLPPYVNYDTEIPGDGFWNVTVWDVIDTTGDTLCYTYE